MMQTAKMNGGCKVGKGERVFGVCMYVVSCCRTDCRYKHADEKEWTLSDRQTVAKVIDQLWGTLEEYQEPRIDRSQECCASGVFCGRDKSCSFYHPIKKVGRKMIVDKCKEIGGEVNLVKKYLATIGLKKVSDGQIFKKLSTIPTEDRTSNQQERLEVLKERRENQRKKQVQERLELRSRNAAHTRNPSCNPSITDEEKRKLAHYYGRQDRYLEWSKKKEFEQLVKEIPPGMERLTKGKDWADEMPDKF